MRKTITKEMVAQLLQDTPVATGDCNCRYEHKHISDTTDEVELVLKGDECWQSNLVDLGAVKVEYVQHDGFYWYNDKWYEISPDFEDDEAESLAEQIEERLKIFDDEEKDMHQGDAKVTLLETFFDLLVDVELYKHNSDVYIVDNADSLVRTSIHREPKSPKELGAQRINPQEAAWLAADENNRIFMA